MRAQERANINIFLNKFHVPFMFDNFPNIREFNPISVYFANITFHVASHEWSGHCSMECIECMKWDGVVSCQKVEYELNRAILWLWRAFCNKMIQATLRHVHSMVKNLIWMEHTKHMLTLTDCRLFFVSLQ